MNLATAALAGVGLYVYVKYYGDPLSLHQPPSFDALVAQPHPEAITDMRWTASRYLRNIHPNEWYRYSDPSAVVNFQRDQWKRQDDAYNPDVLSINPARRTQQRMTTGGAQAIRNPRAPIDY